MGLIDKMRAYLNEEDGSGNGEESPGIIISTEDKPQKKSGGFFSKRKEKTKEEKTKRVKNHELSKEISSAKASKYMENERKAVKDFCEQLVDVSYHTEEILREYQVVTSYLMDIQRIEELPDAMMDSLTDTARKIEHLDKNRQTYLQSENLLSMDQFNNLSNLESEVVGTIKNLNEMEMRDAMLKNDMGHLEGEKEDLKYMREEYTVKMDRIRGVIITVLILFLITVGGLMCYSLVTRNNIMLPSMVVAVVAVLIFVVSYVNYNDYRLQIRDSNAKLKRAVSLLNKVKVKYINNTNTLDYIYEKYGVHSSKELEFQWEQYNIMVSDARKYTHANSEFKRCCDDLVAQLTKAGLEDPLVWPKQTSAIIDKREMVEIKHGLNVRRQKLRERKITCDKIRDNAHIALRAAVADNPGMESSITDFLSPYNIKVDF